MNNRSQWLVVDSCHKNSNLPIKTKPKPSSKKQNQTDQLCLITEILNESYNTLGILAFRYETFNLLKKTWH